MEEGKAIPQSHVQEVNHDAVRPSFGAKLKAYFRKWCPPAIPALEGLASGSPQEWRNLANKDNGIYVAFPKISQDGVHDSTLKIQSLTLSNPTATLFHLEQDALLTNHDKYYPRLDTFNASLSVSSAEEDRPYAYVQLPAVHATETTTTYIDQDVQITDMDLFVDYNT
ncbi:hypothetical protein XANCAGTX0491_006149 [Xanthoria calcicola]